MEEVIPERENKIIKEEFTLGTKFQKFKKRDLQLEQQQAQSLTQKEREKLENSNKENVTVANLFQQHEVVVIYFGATFSPPAQAFLPRLIKFYNEVNTETHFMEIIYVSFDQDQKQYDQAIQQMPWLCIPFDDPRTKKYSQNYEIKGVPNLIVIQKDLQCVHRKAKLDVISCLKENKDPEEVYFAWTKLNLPPIQKPVAQQETKEIDQQQQQK